MYFVSIQFQNKKKNYLKHFFDFKKFYKHFKPHNSVLILSNVFNTRQKVSNQLNLEPVYGKYIES